MLIKCSNTVVDEKNILAIITSMKNWQQWVPKTQDEDKQNKQNATQRRKLTRLVTRTPPKTGEEPWGS